MRTRNITEMVESFSVAKRCFVKVTGGWCRRNLVIWREIDHDKVRSYWTLSTDSFVNYPGLIQAEQYFRVIS